MRMVPEIKDYLKSAKKGDVSAQKQLGVLFSKSSDTLDDGIVWLKKAAKVDADAMYLLGRIYLKKKNDVKRAFAWYEKSAKSGHVDAMVDVGAFYLFGYYVERNVSKAVEWYKKAASLNSAVAMHNLGFLCYQDKDLYATAIELFSGAATLGYADSAYMLGVMYLQGLGVEKNFQKALYYLVRSDELGKHYACRPIGDLYFQGVFDNGNRNHEKAIEWYLRGMEHEVLSCTEALGDCYYYGFGVKSDFNLAFDFYKTAADMGSCDAAFHLGIMCHRGEGTTANIRESLKWMIVAEKLGHKKAPEFVKMITDIIGNRGAAAPAAAMGGSTGIRLRSSYSASAEAVIAEQRSRVEANKKKNASIYAAAGAMSGNGSYTDYEMGAVISADGEVSYVDTDLGIILGSDGCVSSHDSNTGMTYNWSTGKVMAYDETFHATMDLGSGEVSYNYNGYTIQ